MIYSLTNPKLENPALDNQKSDQVIFILKKKDKIKLFKQNISQKDFLHCKTVDTLF